MQKVLLTLSFLLSLSSFSQSSAAVSIETRVTVIEPIRIMKTIEMSFGNVISGYAVGSLTLNPDGSRTANGVVISDALPGEISPAEAVVFHGDNSYVISLPTTFTLINEEQPGQTIIVNQFKVRQQPQTDSYTDVIKIGATLNLMANQIPGHYISETGFPVTVSYN